MEKKPFLTEAMAQEIIQDVPTPFHVYDEKGIRENARRINKAFSWNKGFREYFVVQVDVGTQLIGFFHVVHGGLVGGEHDVAAGKTASLAEHQLGQGGAVHTAALFL